MADDILKRCPRCDTHKSPDEFHSDVTRKSGLATWCKPCNRASSKRWKENNRERIREYTTRYRRENRSKVSADLDAWKTANREAHLAHKKRYAVAWKYDMTVEEYDAFTDADCAICGTREAKICVDHCHDSGKVRGPLCNLCNKGLGQFRDDPARIAAALVYLEQHGKVP